MGKKFWLQFAINEALDVLTAYGTITDPQLAPKVQACIGPLKDLLNTIVGGQ